MILKCDFCENEYLVDELSPDTLKRWSIGSDAADTETRTVLCCPACKALAASESRSSNAVRLDIPPKTVVPARRSYRRSPWFELLRSFASFVYVCLGCYALVKLLQLLCGD